jgi:hypothetical protein
LDFVVAPEELGLHNNEGVASGIRIPPGFSWTILPFCLVERPTCLCLPQAVVFVSFVSSLYLIVLDSGLPSSGHRFVLSFCLVALSCLLCLRRAVVLPPLGHCLISFGWRLAVGDWRESCRSVRRWSGLSGPSSVLGRWESRCLWLWMGGSSIAQAPGPTGTVRELLFGYCWSPPKNLPSMSMRGLLPEPALYVNEGVVRIPLECFPDHLAFLPRQTLYSAFVRPSASSFFFVLSHLNCVVVVPVITVA